MQVMRVSCPPRLHHHNDEGAVTEDNDGEGGRLETGVKALQLN